MKLLWERMKTLRKDAVPVVPIQTDRGPYAIWTPDQTVVYAVPAHAVPDKAPAYKGQALAQFYASAVRDPNWKKAEVHRYEAVLLKGKKILRVVSESGLHCWIAQKNLAGLDSARDCLIYIRTGVKFPVVAVCAERDIEDGTFLPAALIMPVISSTLAEYDRLHPIQTETEC